MTRMFSSQRSYCSSRSLIDSVSDASDEGEPTEGDEAPESAASATATLGVTLPLPSSAAGRAGGMTRALCSMPPDVAVVDWPKPCATVGSVVCSVGYMTDDAVELWRDCGDRPDDADGLGEWPDVYDMVLDGGVTAGVPVDDMAVMGDAMLAAGTGW
ncbi:hypothetical protein CDD83_4597 [Cordyceps sp. RAO-2017]|nr:hypothetical protein CDD83_4597 [Cordyceps sp. RAO-2017]